MVLEEFVIIRDEYKIKSVELVLKDYYRIRTNIILKDDTKHDEYYHKQTIIQLKNYYKAQNNE